ncbi:SLOG family protein [Streptomyces sp. NPDC004330]|uniref:SLOG family protein n=1 Tax=Streptomyces sp. NPDC004330 TaxID=3364700 RepID=UPI0036740770
MAATSHRILVTGSRDWTDTGAVREALDDIHVRTPHSRLLVVVHGAGPTGADAIASAWVREQQRPWLEVHPMPLGELIATLEAADPDLVLPDGFTHPHSYRDYYHERAFKPAGNVTVGDMLADARSALGTTYEGWKGGDYVMSEHTDCWLSGEGRATGDSISSLLLRLI